MKIKMLVSLLLLFLITSSWLIYRENPNNSYRAPGTSVLMISTMSTVFLQHTRLLFLMITMDTIRALQICLLD